MSQRCASQIELHEVISPQYIWIRVRLNKTWDGQVLPLHSQMCQNRRPHLDSIFIWITPFGRDPALLVRRHSIFLMHLGVDKTTDCGQPYTVDLTMMLQSSQR